MNDSNRTVAIGESMIRPDALTKVRGEERFAVDHYPPGLLWAGVKRAGIPHGLLRSIATEDAARTPGVHAVLTAKDINGTNRQGVIRKDQPVLVDERIRHCGDPVALVVAETQEILTVALERIRFEVEPLEPVFDPLTALHAGAPLLHPDHPDGNALFTTHITVGAGESGFADCEEIVEGEFDLPRQAHAFLETENGWARTDNEGRVEITVSTQTPFRDRSEVAEALGLGVDRVRIIAPYCGGAFGGKDGITVQSLLALAALHCPGRPVKMWWHREESFLAGVKRHPARLRYRLGAERSGKLTALSVEAWFDTGPYDHLGGVVAALGIEHAGGPYRITHVDLKTRAVYTNNPVSGAFRGFGVPQVTAAMESMIDLLARRLQLCPLELRRRNALVRGDRCPAGSTRQGSIGLTACLDRLATHPLWTTREQWCAAAGPHRSRGTGIAAVAHGMGYGPLVPDTATAGIELLPDGRFSVQAGVVDMGQGNAATYLQMAADILNQPPDRLLLILPDTDRTFPCGSSSASRTTFTYANALIPAARELRERLLARASELLLAQDPREMLLIPGAVRHLPSGRDVDLARLGSLLSRDERFVSHHYRAPAARETPSDNSNLRLHGFPHQIFSHAVHLARVEVDELTGRVSVAAYLTISDCGRIINPVVFAGQQEGAVAQGIGYALCEDVLVDQGRLRTTDLATYILPTALDVPPLETLTVSLAEHDGPFGLKGAGEIGIDAPAPALANAVEDACSVRLTRFPLTAERILNALTERNNSRRS